MISIIGIEKDLQRGEGEGGQPVCACVRGKGKTNSQWAQMDPGKIKRKREFCPKCEPGVFLAVHKNRTSCGKCGYTKMND